MLQLYRSKYEYIKEFVIYGERHSGTKFLEQSIQSLFQIPKTGFFGHKHWMGFAKPERIWYERHTLFLGIVRDPYDWLLALYDLPHHIPRHNRNNFKRFLLNEHYSVDQNEQEILQDRNFAHSHKPRYKNIFELRSNKLVYLNEIMPDLASNYVFMTYENLIANYYHIMNIISCRFDLKKKGKVLQPNPIKHRGFRKEEDKKIITDNIDWDAERKVGYHPK